MRVGKQRYTDRNRSLKMNFKYIHTCYVLSQIVDILVRIPGMLGIVDILVRIPGMLGIVDILVRIPGMLGIVDILVRIPGMLGIVDYLSKDSRHAGDS